MSDSASRAYRLDRALADLLAQAPEVEAAAVVSFDGLPMASALPATMDDGARSVSSRLLLMVKGSAEGDNLLGSVTLTENTPVKRSRWTRLLRLPLHESSPQLPPKIAATLPRDCTYSACNRV